MIMTIGNIKSHNLYMVLTLGVFLPGKVRDNACCLDQPLPVIVAYEAAELKLNSRIPPQMKN